MFSFLRKNFLPRTDSCFLQFSSINVRFISTDSTTHNSFVVSYLINTCGLPKEKAIAFSTPRRIHFESSKKPDLVLAFFRDNGFFNTQISKIIGSFPELLMSKVDKTLKPKFDFFISKGISGSDLAQVLSQYPFVLKASLDKRIIPNFDVMISFIHSDAKLLTLLKRLPHVLTQDPRKNVLPNVALLRAQGVPDDNIARLLVSQTRLFLTPTSHFCEIVKEVRHMKFEPSQYIFLEAVRGLAQMTRSSWEAKIDVYRRWGLSEEEVKLMFRKSPHCFMISVKNITSTMNYFVNEMGYTPSVIVKCPSILSCSLTRRIIPRCSVIHILKRNGVVGTCSLSSLIIMSDKNFVKRFISKFEKEVPEVLTAYKGNEDECCKSLL